MSEHLDADIAPRGLRSWVRTLLGISEAICRSDCQDPTCSCPCHSGHANHDAEWDITR